jgi:prepilin-type N-terminal cleavage/methylation domain-containing protein
MLHVFRSRARRVLSRAFTLVEMLIAMALTLILVYAIAEFYAYVGTTVKDGRAMIDIVSQMRLASARLKADLELVTVKVAPWTDDGWAGGYFEIFEGPACDTDANGDNILDVNQAAAFASGNVTSMNGDTDDILAFTIRTDGAHFTGRAYNPNTSSYYNISSNHAEVIWFTGFADRDGDNLWDLGEPTYLYRRLLLIVPGAVVGLPTGANIQEFYHHNDVSAHLTGIAANPIAPNTLVDLARRENRFGHRNLPVNFPNQLDLNPRDSASLTLFTLQGTNLGEDRVLANLLSFDVRVFDPGAVIRMDGENGSNGTADDDSVGTLQPGDAGYLTALMNNNATTYTPVGYGAYVDVGYGHQLHDQLLQAPFSATSAAATTAINTPAASSTVPYSQFRWQTNYLAQIGRTYDTWAQSYERDGYNQDFAADGAANINTGPFDEGTDGLDDNPPGTLGVDDAAERETVPPYPFPLRGLQVRLRMYEPSTRQTRQATIGWDFISE